MKFAIGDRVVRIHRGSAGMSIGSAWTVSKFSAIDLDYFYVKGYIYGEVCAHNFILEHVYNSPLYQSLK